MRWIVVGMLAQACGSASPAAPTRDLAITVGGAESGESASVMSMTATNKEPINGTIQFLAAAPPGRSVITPTGHCHFWDSPAFTHFDGDVEGMVTFNEQLHAPCDFSHIAGSGPMEGQVIWRGRAGTISGQWTTNCKADVAQPTGVSCDGTMNARGSGGLDGVQFHFKWGPGWYPFSYDGTAFSK